jgi:hypothetical protein
VPTDGEQRSTAEEVSATKQTKEETHDNPTAPVETIEVEDDSLLTKVKEVAHEGNVRRIRILYEDEELIDVSTDRGRRRRAPPRVSAAIGAIAAIVTGG